MLEARDRLGGACTLDTPFEDKDFVLSPCAYVIGLLDENVINDLQLNKRGLEVFVADPQLWVPFDDGTAFSQWMSHERTRADLRAIGLPEKEIDGYEAYENFFDDMRIRLRKGPRDSWAGESPSRPELEEMLQGDQMMIDALFDASISDVLDEFVTDQRLKDALFGQGIIGTCAGPKDPGTASVKLMHFQGDLLGEGPIWGYVKGGMGMVSFAIAEAAREAGAVLAAGVPVGEILPGEGVRLDDGTFIAAPVVVSNTDPKRVLDLVADDAMPTAYGERLRDWDITSPGREVQRGAEPAAQLHRRTGRDVPLPRHRRRDRWARRRAGGVRAVRDRASPRSASARSTARPCSTRRPRPRASTC